MDQRFDYLTWDDMYMQHSRIAAQRSKDPNTQVGATLVSPDQRISSHGYNGAVNGIDDKEVPWGSKYDEEPLNNKYAYIIHAEVNALLNYAGDTRGTTLYTTLYPCGECAKMIAHCGVKRVVYSQGDPNAHSQRIFDLAGIIVEHYVE